MVNVSLLSLLENPNDSINLIISRMMFYISWRICVHTYASVVGTGVGDTS